MKPSSPQGRAICQMPYFISRRHLVFYALDSLAAARGARLVKRAASILRASHSAYFSSLLEDMQLTPQHIR